MSTNNKWQALSMRDRAFLIREAVRNGITDIDSIRDTWEHRFDGESDQPTEEKPWYKKLASAISEGARMARDARIGAVGAEQVRELYRKGENEKAQKQAEQYAHANIADISTALGKTTDAILPNILNLSGAIGAGAIVSDGFKNNNEYNPKIYTSTPAEKVTNIRTAEEDMMQRIERIENKKNKKGGWDNDKKIWFAHDSYEGGAPTIGYGIKLNRGTKAREVFDRQGGFLTEAQEREFRTELMQNALRQAKKAYDKKFGPGQFDLLDFKAQSLLGDKEYNVIGGVNTFPKLMTAVHNNDIEEIKKQVITKAKKKGSKKFSTLGNRNDDFLQDIDSLKQGIYNIYKK